MNKNNQNNKEKLIQLLSPLPIIDAIYVAANLNIADYLLHGALTIEQLAVLTETHEQSIYRLMRALASLGLFNQKDRVFELTEFGKLLASDTEGSMKHAVLGHMLFYRRSLSELPYSVKTGNKGFERAFGMPLFEYFSQNPHMGKIFDDSMQTLADVETQPFINAFDFTSYETIVDIGGGNGSLINAVLTNTPSSKGIVFDLPEVVSRTQERLRSLKIHDRCGVCAGNFFDEVVPGDIYILRRIIHDWNDEEAVKILSNCRNSLRPNGKILIHELVISSDNEPQSAKWFDLTMLIVGGMERTEGEYRSLLSGAGLKLSRLIPTTGEMSIIEAEPL